MTEPGLGFLETPYACRPNVTTARPTPYEQAERTKNDNVSGARRTIATRLTGVVGHNPEVVTQMSLGKAPDDAPDEVKRAMTVTTLRRQLLQRNWDSSCANALAVGTKGSKTKKLVMMALEAYFGKVQRPNLLGMRAIKIKYADDKAATPSQIGPEHEDYDAFNAALAAKAVEWLLAAQKEMAATKGARAPETADYNSASLGGVTGGTEADFKAHVVSTVRQTIDSTLAAALLQECSEQLKVVETYKAAQDKKKKAAMDASTIDGKAVRVEEQHGIWIPRSTIPSGLNLTWLGECVAEQKWPDDPKLEPENLKAFADKGNNIIPVESHDVWTVETGELKSVAGGGKLKRGPPTSVAEIYEGTRLLMVGLFLLSHEDTCTNTAEASRGANGPMMTPAALYSFLEMLQMCVNVYAFEKVGADRLYTLRNRVVREMKKLVNEAPYASYDHALKAGRRALFRDLTDFQDSRVILLGQPCAAEASEDATPDKGSTAAKKDAKVDKKTVTIAETAEGDAKDKKIAKLEEDLKKKVATITELQNKLGERKKEVEDLRAKLRDASQGQHRSGPARDGYVKRRDSDRDRSPSPRERQRDGWRRRK